MSATPGESPVDLSNFERVATARRTQLPTDADGAIADEIVARLVTLVASAPNHHRTTPWRVCVVRGSARGALGAAFAADLAATGRGLDDPKVRATATKYLRAPVVLVIGCESSPTADDLRRREDRDAVAAGVQTLLLGATAAGLTSFWASAPAPRGPEALALCGFAPGTEIAAVVYLGTGPSTLDGAVRPAPPTVWLGDHPPT